MSLQSNINLMNNVAPKELIPFINELDDNYSIEQEAVMKGVVNITSPIEVPGNNVPMVLSNSYTNNNPINMSQSRILPITLYPTLVNSTTKSTGYGQNVNYLALFSKDGTKTLPSYSMDLNECFNIPQITSITQNDKIVGYSLEPVTIWNAYKNPAYKQYARIIDQFGNIIEDNVGTITTSAFIVFLADATIPEENTRLKNYYQMPSNLILDKLYFIESVVEVINASGNYEVSTIGRVLINPLHTSQVTFWIEENKVNSAFLNRVWYINIRTNNLNFLKDYISNTNNTVILNITQTNSPNKTLSYTITNYENIGILINNTNWGISLSNPSLNNTFKFTLTLNGLNETYDLGEYTFTSVENLTNFFWSWKSKIINYFNDTQSTLSYELLNRFGSYYFISGEDWIGVADLNSLSKSPNGPYTLNNIGNRINVQTLLQNYYTTHNTTPDNNQLSSNLAHYTIVDSVYYPIDSENVFCYIVIIGYNVFSYEKIPNAISCLMKWDASNNTLIVNNSSINITTKCWTPYSNNSIGLVDGKIYICPQWMGDYDKSLVTYQPTSSGNIELQVYDLYNYTWSSYPLTGAYYKYNLRMMILKSPFDGKNIFIYQGGSDNFIPKNLTANQAKENLMTLNTTTNTWWIAFENNPTSLKQIVPNITGPDGVDTSAVGTEGNLFMCPMNIGGIGFGASKFVAFGDIGLSGDNVNVYSGELTYDDNTGEYGLNIKINQILPNQLRIRYAAMKMIDSDGYGIFTIPTDTSAVFGYSL